MPATSKGLSVLAALLALTATHSLAGPYEDGLDAYNNKHYALAMKLWRPLAEGYDARAQAGVAKLYYSGLGVRKNYDRALFWGEQAAAHGDARAQYIVGTMYREGEDAKVVGVAGFSLDRLAKKMTPKAITEARKLVLEWKPVQSGGR